MSEPDSTPTIVRLLVTTAANDHTNPPCWRTDVLIGTIEKLLVHTDKQPAQFAKICEQALPQVTDPNNRAIIRLGVVNGRRRTSDTSVEEVQRLFEEVYKEIEALPEGPRKSRCQSFWRYQARVFMARNGYYEQAAKTEEEGVAAAVAPEERAVSRFLSHLYGLWSALTIERDNREDITLRLVELRDELEVMQRDTKGTSLEIQWGQCNGPIHMLQALVLTDNRATEGPWIPNLEMLLSQNSSDFEIWTKLFEVEDLRRKGQIEQVKNRAQEFVTAAAMGTRGDILAFARLILARIYRETGDIERARTTYDLIRPVPDAHMVAAVARRELASLGD